MRRFDPGPRLQFLVAADDIHPAQSGTFAIQNHGAPCACHKSRDSGLPVKLLACCPIHLLNPLS
jgi:hypothetical protein